MCVSFCQAHISFSLSLIWFFLFFWCGTQSSIYYCFRNSTEWLLAVFFVNVSCIKTSINAYSNIYGFIHKFVSLSLSVCVFFYCYFHRNHKAHSSFSIPVCLCLCFCLFFIETGNCSSLLVGIVVARLVSYFSAFLYLTHFTVGD